jgi:molybdopterin converting factor small subunit
VEVQGASVRQIIDNLESLHPGIKARLLTGDELRPGIAVAINSQLAREGLAQKVPEGAEVHFIPAISGGCAADTAY